jgi:predicted dehydrogenase
MNKKLRLGVIGIGYAWDRLHYPALQKLTEQYEIVAVCNKTISKAQGFAQSIGLPQENIYDDYVKLLEQDDIDVVDILVPISENFEIVEAAILAGKNIIAEKPFASTPKAASMLIQLKDKHHVKIMVAENFRYDEGNKIIKDCISNGTIGEVMYFIQNTAADFEKDMKENTFAAKEWRQHPDFIGGILLDGGVHDIARMRYLFGDFESIYATGRKQEEEYNPYICVNSLMKFKNGVSGQYSFYAQGTELQKPPVGLRIYGTLGEIYYESKDKGIIEISHKDGTNEQKSFAPNNGYYHELLNFYNSVNIHEEIIATPEKELGDIQGVFDILKSIESNTLIKM